MEYRKFDNYYVVRLEKGEEIIESIKNICTKESIKSGLINGIGATDDITIGLFNPKTKEYIKKDFSENFEITCLNGNISTLNNEIYLHLHITVTNEEFTAIGGHLNRAVISGTGEIIIKKINGEIDRNFDEFIGLNLISFK